MHEHSLTPIIPGGVYFLNDANEQVLGTLRVQRIEGDRVFGHFEAKPAFREAAELFAELEEAVQANMMSVADESEQLIESLGLHIKADSGSTLPAIHHVQIYDGNQIFFHIRGGYPAPYAEIAASQLMR